MCDDEASFIPDYDEVGLEEKENISTSPSKKGAMRHGGRPCPLCSNRYSHVRRHVTQAHLPWYFNPMATCWKCHHIEPQRNFLNRHIAGCCENGSGHYGPKLINRWRALMCGLFWVFSQIVGVSGEQELVRWAQEHSCIEHQVWHPQDIKCAQQFKGKGNNEDDPSSGNEGCLSSLTHWRVFSNMLLHVDSEKRKYLKSVEKMRCSSFVTG